MKESYWGYWLVMLGILVIGVMLLVNSTTTGTTQDYYELKETTSAAMVDAVDYSYYRLYGDIKIAKEKFIENFIRRFSESATMTKKYNISFYDIQEVPPKVSVKISSVSNSVNVANSANSFDLVNKIDMLLLAGSSNGSTVPDSVGTCELSIDPRLAVAIKEVLTTGSSDDIPKEIASRMLSVNLPSLKKWAETDGDASKAEGNYWNQFVAAFATDFSDSFGSTTISIGQFVTLDPTRPKEAGTSFSGYDTENYQNYKTSGLLGYAYHEKNWINLV